MKQKTPPIKHHPVQDLESEDIHHLGECVGDLVARLGYGAKSSPLEAVLFREAIDQAVYLLTLRQAGRASLTSFYKQRGYGPPEYSPISIEPLAQHTIFQTDENPGASIQELQARVQFALTLDHTCTEAYLLEGGIEERQGHYHEALISYTQAMELAAEKLGPEAFTKAGRKEVHFWYSTGTRPYMQARTAIAYVLWQKLGNLPAALDHFRALLDLNPGDNQGNRFAIICCLLEHGDDETLGEALQRYFTSTDDYGEETDLRETCWWYTNACWKFRRVSQSSERSTRQAASKALRAAFSCNTHVPYFLLNQEALVDFGEPDAFSRGSLEEAVWYALLSLKGWQQTPGALDWFGAAARRAGL